MTSTNGSGIWNQLLSCTSNCSHIISLNKHGFLVSIGLHTVAWVRFNVWICSLSLWQLFGGTTIVAMVGLLLGLQSCHFCILMAAFRTVPLVVWFCLVSTAEVCKTLHERSPLFPQIPHHPDRIRGVLHPLLQGGHLPSVLRTCSGSLSFSPVYPPVKSSLHLVYHPAHHKVRYCHLSGLKLHKNLTFYERIKLWWAEDAYPEVERFGRFIHIPVWEKIGKIQRLQTSIHCYSLWGWLWILLYNGKYKFHQHLNFIFQMAPIPVVKQIHLYSHLWYTCTKNEQYSESLLNLDYNVYLYNNEGRFLLHICGRHWIGIWRSLCGHSLPQRRLPSTSHARGIQCCHHQPRINLKRQRKTSLTVPLPPYYM